MWTFFTLSCLVASCPCKKMQVKHNSLPVVLLPIMRDVSLQSIATDVDSSISPASSQDSCNVKTRSSFPFAPQPADIVSFGNDDPQSKFHLHLVTNFLEIHQDPIYRIRCRLQDTHKPRVTTGITIFRALLNVHHSVNELNLRVEHAPTSGARWSSSLGIFTPQPLAFCSIFVQPFPVFEHSIFKW